MERAAHGPALAGSGIELAGGLRVAVLVLAGAGIAAARAWPAEFIVDAGDVGERVHALNQVVAGPPRYPTQQVVARVQVAFDPRLSRSVQRYKTLSVGRPSWIPIVTGNPRELVGRAPPVRTNLPNVPSLRRPGHIGQPLPVR